MEKEKNHCAFFFAAITKIYCLQSRLIRPFKLTATVLAKRIQQKLIDTERSKEGRFGCATDEATSIPSIVKISLLYTKYSTF